MQVMLKVLSGNHEGKLIPIKDEKFFIGRSDSCQLRPKSESISRKHCVIVQKDGRALLLDLKSRNGTFINEKQVSSDKAKILKSGDRLRCGQLEFEVLIEVGIANSKKPEVHSVKEAAERMTEQSNTLDSRESFDISAWLEEADQIDRVEPVRTTPQVETRQFNMEDTTRVEATQMEVESVVPIDSKTDDNRTEPTEPAKKKFEKKPPLKLPKMASGPTTGNTKEAATETLKRYFGGR